MPCNSTIKTLLHYQKTKIFVLCFTNTGDGQRENLKVRAQKRVQKEKPNKKGEKTEKETGKKVFLPQTQNDGSVC